MEPQPPHVPAEGLAQQRQRRQQQHHCCVGQDLRRRDRQHYPLDGGDHLPPGAGRQGCAHPWCEHSDRNEEIPGDADHQHPGTEGLRYEDTQHQDQERVHLHVEPGAQRGHRPGPSRDLPVDAVEEQCDCAQCHQHRHQHRHRCLRRSPGRCRRTRGFHRRRNQCGDATHQGGPGQGDGVRRTQGGAAVPVQRAGEKTVGHRSDQDADHPSGRPDPDGRRKDAE